jgi:hypothetical protein
MESRRLPKLYVRHFSSSPDGFGAGSDQDRDTANVSVVSSCPSRCLPRARVAVAGALVQLALITASSRRMPASAQGSLVATWLDQSALLHLQKTERKLLD